jgi:uncharacterized membrane protein required for colicin V production
VKAELAMDWVDWIILAVLVGAVLGGMAQGFFRTVCSLLGLILGIALAWQRRSNRS